jgi:hypothetical protein
MELPEIYRLEGGVENGSARWATRGLSGYEIYVIERERVRLRKWFTETAMRALRHKQRLATHENEGGSEESRVYGPVRCTSLSTSQTTSPYQSTHEPHDSAFTIASPALDSSFRVLRALSE